MTRGSAPMNHRPANSNQRCERGQKNTGDQGNDERPPEDRLLFTRVVASISLRNKASRSRAHEIEAGEDHIEHNRTGSKPAKQCCVAELANDGGIHQSKQRRRQVGKRHRDGDGQNRTMRDGKCRAGIRQARSVVFGEACHNDLPIRPSAGPIDGS